jgi:hypothetical protein
VSSRSDAGSPSRAISVASELANAKAMAAVPIHPAARPRSERQPNAFTRQPASGNASTSQA